MDLKVLVAFPITPVSFFIKSLVEPASVPSTKVTFLADPNSGNPAEYIRFLTFNRDVSLERVRNPLILREKVVARAPFLDVIVLVDP